VSFSVGVPLLVLREFWTILTSGPLRTGIRKEASRGKQILEAFAALGNLTAAAIPKIAVGILLIIAGWCFGEGDRSRPADDAQPGAL
jgi:hypothetical protein